MSLIVREYLRIAYGVQMSIPVLLPFICVGSHTHRTVRQTFRAFLTITSTVSPPPGEPIQHLHNVKTAGSYILNIETHPMPIEGIFWPLLKVKYGMSAAMFAMR